MHAFGIFDGHGCSAAAADVCKAYLLQEPIAPQLKKRKSSFCGDEAHDDPAMDVSYGSYNSSYMDGTIHKGQVPTSPELRAMAGTDMPSPLASGTTTTQTGPSALSQLLDTVASAPLEALGWEEDGSSSSTSSTESAQVPRTEVGSWENRTNLEKAPDTLRSTPEPTSPSKELQPPTTAPETPQHILLTPPKTLRGLIPNDTDIVESFRSVDAQFACEHRGVRCGTTATSVYIGYDPMSDTWDVKCGWAGDSRAVLIEPDAKTFANLAIDHRIENDAERERIDVAAKTDLLPNGTPRSYITRRQNSRGEYGPKAVFSGTTGISHLMTRSIGDPHGAPALIPDAEIISKQGVANGSWVVLASDGLWDVFDEAGVAKVVRSTRHPARAARKLTLDSVARRRQYGMTADDVTVIVIELTAPVIQPPESRTSPSKVADIDH
mmetsp:Transcript_83606/g.235913  ORF Transcript_83606/g.235913 Transcript_83606/m.235913 type:complete len:437 (-) Transcript_83606:316-1626(-)